MAATDFLRYAADIALSVPSLLNLRPYTITCNTVTWSGSRPGLGTATITTQAITNDGYTNVRFRQVSKEDIALSGGALRDQDVVIGPIVFPYDTGTATGGIDPNVFSPATGMSPTEFYVNVQGPNFPSGGLQFKKIYDATERNVVYRVYLRNTSATLP